MNHVLYLSQKQSINEKNIRLNTELNYILHNDDKRIVDIDTLVLENQYLKEVIKQYKEEKNVANHTVARYKEALKYERKNTPNSPTKSHQTDGFFSKSVSQNTINDLQRVNKALTEKVSEKELALKHQRNTNRILGTRVYELEKKLKTLEISGLWSHEKRTPREISINDFADSENTKATDNAAISLPTEPPTLTDETILKGHDSSATPTPPETPEKRPEEKPLVPENVSLQENSFDPEVAQINFAENTCDGMEVQMKEQNVKRLSPDSLRILEDD